MQRRKPRKVNLNNAARDVRRGYPLDWPMRSWCGRVVRARNHEPHPATGSHVVLTTADLFGREQGAASLLNLAALCQRCYLNHDRAQHLQSRRTNRDRATGQLTG